MSAAAEVLTGGPMSQGPPGDPLQLVIDIPGAEGSDADSQDLGSEYSDSNDELASLSEIGEEEEEGSGNEFGVRPDPVFEKIKESLSRTQKKSESALSVASDMSADSGDGPHVQISEQYTSIPYGIQPRATYEHAKTNSDIMGVAYNSRMRQFVILDSKGITTWKRDMVDPRVRRALQHPKYEYRLITNIVYAAKYNCYFALGKDFSLKVLNRDFEETFSVNADLRSVLFMLFNPVKDELITGGVGGIKVWCFKQATGQAFQDLKPLANYRLDIKYTLPDVGGSWVKRVDLDHQLQHLYCCSDTDLHVYDLNGKLLFKFERAHTMSITGCCYSPTAKFLITSSVDSEVKVWSLTGGQVHTFRGHSRAVTSMILHPDCSSIVITASLDGSIRMWSLDFMDLLYMIVVSTDGVLWMGLTDDKLLYVSTCRYISLWSLNYFYQFWGLARNQLTHMYLSGCKEKTTRLVALGEDSSVRLFIRSNRRNITTVLPPPDISPLQKVLSVCYSREFNVAFLLVSSKEIWVYTTRTDPSCRIAVWDVHELQVPYTFNRPPADSGEIQQIKTSSSVGHGVSHRATENGSGNEVVANCCSLCILNSTAMMWTDEGFCCPIRHSYLLLGLEGPCYRVNHEKWSPDGRILFMDPVVKGQKFMEFKASKDAIRDMRQDISHSCLITLSRLKQLMLVQIWGLPQLDLNYELYTAPDINICARLGLTFFTGHETGHLNFHFLEPAEDLGLSKAKQEPEYDDVVEKRRPEHNARVVALDSVVTLRIFISASADGAIKVWDENKMLLTEVMMDESLSSACFLNDLGDVLIGFKNHIFFIDHTRICPHFKPPEIEMETSDQESDVYEDPAVLYEGIIPNPDPLTKDNYLVPYQIEFSRDFLEGKLKIEHKKAKTEETVSDTDSTLSMAPTYLYYSPPDSPGPLSNIDMTLGAGYSDYDLYKHMEYTMQEMARRHKERQKRQKYPVWRWLSMIKHKNRPRRQRRHVGLMGELPGVSDKEDDRDVREKRMLPMFGASPGPSPDITPPPSARGSPIPDKPKEEQLPLGGEGVVKIPKDFKPIKPGSASPSPEVPQTLDDSTEALTPVGFPPPTSISPVTPKGPSVNTSPTLATKVYARNAASKAATSKVSSMPGTKMNLKSKKMSESKQTTSDNIMTENMRTLKKEKEINKHTDSRTDFDVFKSLKKESSDEISQSGIGKGSPDATHEREIVVDLDITQELEASILNEHDNLVHFEKEPDNEFSTTKQNMVGENKIKSSRTFDGSDQAFITLFPLTGAAETPENFEADQIDPSRSEEDCPLSICGSGFTAESDEDYNREVSMEELQNQSSTLKRSHDQSSGGGGKPVRDSGQTFGHSKNKENIRPPTEGPHKKVILEQKAPAKKVQRPDSIKPDVEDVPEVQEESTQRRPGLRGIKVDVHGLMKEERKKRITSGRAPSMTRRSSTDHSHPDLDHDHDHDHDLKLHQQKKQRNQKKKEQQMMQDRKMPKRGDPSKMKPPSMLDRRRPSWDFRLKDYHPPHEIYDRHRSTHDPAEMDANQKLLVKYDDQTLDDAQESLWAQEAGLMGTKLTLPEKKIPTTALKKVPPPLPLNKSRPQKTGESQEDAPDEREAPGVGHSPTEELEDRDSVTLMKEKSEKDKQDAEKPETDGMESDRGSVSNLDSNVPETQMQRHSRLGNRFSEDEKAFDSDHSGTAGMILKKKKVNVYLPRDDRDDTKTPTMDLHESYRATPDSGIGESAYGHTSSTSAGKGLNKLKEEEEELSRRRREALLFSDLDKTDDKQLKPRPNSSYMGLRRRYLSSGDARARPQTAHVKFRAELEFIIELPDKLEDLQAAFEEALQRYCSLPGTPADMSESKLYKNDGTGFEENWHERAIERHLLLKMQKEIRLQSAAQRRQARETQQQEKLQQNILNTENRSKSAIETARPETTFSSFRPQTVSTARPPTTRPQTQKEQHPQTAHLNLQQQNIKSQLGAEKSFRFKMNTNKTPSESSRPSSSRSSISDFSPKTMAELSSKLFDPRNPNAIRPKTCRSIPSKCSQYVLVSKKEKNATQLPSPLEEQLLMERFPKMGMKVLQGSVEPIVPSPRRTKKIEYSPFIYQRFS